MFTIIIIDKQEPNLSEIIECDDPFKLVQNIPDFIPEIDHSTCEADRQIIANLLLKDRHIDVTTRYTMTLIGKRQPIHTIR